MGNKIDRDTFKYFLEEARQNHIFPIALLIAILQFVEEKKIDIKFGGKFFDDK